MALPTTRGIYWGMIRLSHTSRALSKKPGREQHPFLGRSYPESAASFAAKFAEGAIGKSGRKISVKGLQAKWAGLLVHACISTDIQITYVRIQGYEKAASLQ
jgi:hypothetical protein